MSAGRHVTEEERAAIRAARTSGKSLRDIAIRFSRGPSTVRAICKGIVPIEQSQAMKDALARKSGTAAMRKVNPNDVLTTDLAKMAGIRGPCVRRTEHFARTGTLPVYPERWWDDG